MNSQQVFDVKEQSTSETCLAVCLIALLRQKGIKVSDSQEINILLEGIKFTKLDFSTGHLVYLCKRYPINVEQYIDFPEFQKILSKLDIPDSLKLIPKKINEKFMQQMTKISPVIVYIDKYDLEKIFHYPHFVILISLDNKTAFIFDPWDGKYSKIHTKTLIRSIQSLRNRLRVSPKLICLL